MDDKGTPLVAAASDDAWERPERLPTSPVLHLEGFDGPMDLLLDLVERQRIDFGGVSILDLAEQFTAAMARFAGQVSLERRADWLVLATRLVLLRSRLLFPASPEAAADAEAEAAQEIRRLDERIAMRAAGAWLGQRPQLGVDTFARPLADPPREGGYVALMEACLVVLRGPDDRGQPEPVYSRILPDLWRVSDALVRIPELLARHPQGGEIAAFLPPIAPHDPDRDEKLRTAFASTLLAGLELAKQGEVAVEQTTPMGLCWLRGA
ncbi:segregation/condensation protein A [Acidisoma cellulosilytica]|uniref:Segregation and condensation protein A n=1 Tax=Acidisoma cellulosilyticum TaxID=2802395 RepID=A0A964E5N5_9PROT|nr:segregation/condensation protein A [Acidisoma cellulosilyticum]MCB8882704.1 segregation/condensation protein A [Acidisoma cellulosilyticum]